MSVKAINESYQALVATVLAGVTSFRGSATISGEWQMVAMQIIRNVSLLLIITNRCMEFVIKMLSSPLKEVF